jgi:MoaA/NifB/PqqE/SkfB family radical SAM enzyme
MAWPLTVDIEPTNRCNAKCHFCPRDATPHQGLMAPEVFAQALARTVELQDFVREVLDREVVVSLCGLGEPLLNRHTPDFVRQVREAGFTCVLSSNAALLDEKRGQALLDAGLQRIFINVGDHDEGYEDVYKLPFEKTRDNVVRFSAMAEGRCEVRIVLVDFRRDEAHLQEMKRFWRDHGIDRFDTFGIINRGGALFVDEMQFESYPERDVARRLLGGSGPEPVCGAPFGYLFVGYDGQYYLCCSDWKKDVPLGSVFDESFLSVTRAKLAHVTSREPICRTCNHDPLNRLTEELRAMATGDADERDRDALIAEIQHDGQIVRDLLGTMLDAYGPDPETPAKAPRRLIPVVAE